MRTQLDCTKLKRTTTEATIPKKGGTVTGTGSLQPQGDAFVTAPPETNRKRHRIDKMNLSPLSFRYVAPRARSAASKAEREQCLEILFHVTGIRLIALLASGRESIDGARLYPLLALFLFRSSFVPRLPFSLACRLRSLLLREVYIHMTL